MTGGDARAHLRSAMLALCGVLGTAAPAAHAQAPEPIALRDGAVRHASHLAAERFEYAVTVAAGETYLLRVEQQGLDLILTVHSPGGASTQLSSPLFRDGDEVAVLAGAAGVYRIEIRSDEHTDARGGHTATLSRVLPGTDARELEAWRAMSAGAAANFAAGDDGWKRAADSYAAAAEIWSALGRTREQADALFAVAAVRYWQLFDWDGSIELAARAATLYRELGAAGFEANAVHLQGAALVEKALEAQQASAGTAISAESAALFANALGLLEQARAAHERLGNVYDLALVLNNFGYTYYGKGELDRARRHYAEAATLLESIAESTMATRPLANIAVLDAEVGQLVRARATFERVLELLPPDLELRRSRTLDNLAATERMLGDLERALATSAAALELQRKIDDGQGEGRSLRRIGETYYSLGQADLATEYLEQALPIAVATNDGRNQEATLRGLGNVAFLERDYAAALDYHRRALEIAASVSDRAHLELLVAKDLLALGRAADARDAAQHAAQTADATGSQTLRAGALSALGRAQTLGGEPAAAIATLERATAIFESLDLGAEHADALHGLALAARAAGELDQALGYGARALSELDGLRAQVADPELRAFFGGARRDYYETQIDLLMARAAHADGAAGGDYARRALQVSERGRARMVADLLHESALDLRGGIDAGLRSRQNALYDKLAESRHRRDQLIEQGKAGEALEQSLAELAALENDLNLVEIELRRDNPQYRALTAPEVLTPEQMRARLDADTVLLQYALGDGASYVWAVTRDGIAAMTLADRPTIEAAVRRVATAVQAGATADDASSAAALQDLAALVLAPAGAHLAKARVVLALDGALQYVPFGALPIAASDGTLAPLLATHEVVEVPSLSVLALAARERAPDSRKTLAVFADPVLQPTDPRLRALQSAPVAAPPMPAVAARTSGGAELQRLLSTSYEGQAIAGLVADDRRLLASGFAANRAAVLGAQLGDFRYIHFATHGLVDSRYPGLSALVLSQFDERGRPQDGFLRLNDIYGLKLDADLVVLSACDTALGREIRGEGLIGLTQGFLSAGARSLVASLWQVPDRATAELMTQFYRYVLTDGLRPSDALRKAQLWSASQRRYRHPYYWAGFVLVGDWR
jgi:CHAT domain-containing protein